MIEIDNITEARLLSNLKADFTASKLLRNELDQKIARWKSEYNAEPYGNEVNGRSKLVSRDIKKQSEWQHAALIEPFVSTPDIIKANPVTSEDAEIAPKIEVLLNTQFCRQFSRYNFMTKALKVLDQEGTVVIRTGWEYEEKIVEVEEDREIPNPDYQRAIEAINQGMADPSILQGIEPTLITKVRVRKTKPVKNHPTAMVCRNEDIFIDPTCQDDMDKCQFVIYRYETDMTTLKQAGIYKNLDKIKIPTGLTGTNDTEYITEDSTSFRFSDTARKKIVVHEYWGNYDINGDDIAEPIVCTWIDNTIIRLEANPFPDKKPPFLIVPFSAIPFKLYGESNAELLSDIQKIKTAIYRGFIDNMALSNNGQKGIKKGSLDEYNKQRFLNGENFEFNHYASDFFIGNFNELPSSIFNVLTLMNNEAESITGVASFNTGINGNALGSMLDIETNIPLIDGSVKKLKDIKDGDIIVGSNGKGTLVTKAHEIQYPKQAYELCFSNGEIVKGGGEHLWTVKVTRPHRRKLQNWHTIDGDTLYEYLQQGYTVHIPRISRIDIRANVTLDIDPYCLGAWLGDGNSHGARITSPDKEIVDRFSDAEFIVKESSLQGNSGKATNYEIVGHKSKVKENTLHAKLHKLNLLKRYGGEKHIPEEYFRASYNEKLELLRGLMDTDGYLHKCKSGAIFTQVKGRLLDDVLRLLTSMGIQYYLKEKSAEYLNRIKDQGSGMSIRSNKDLVEVYFSCLDNPFYLSRKASQWKAPTSKVQLVKVESVEKCEKVLMRCLTVDSIDRLYAFGKFYTLTHNTATSIRGAIDSASTRRLNIVRNISENLVKPLLRKWLAYDAMFLDEESQYRITNDTFVYLKRDDLGANIDIDLSISTSDDNRAKAQELAFVLQTVGPSEDPRLRKILMAQIAQLYRMPDLAKMIMDYKPEPDPMAEQMQQLQMQLLQAEIANTQAKAGENTVDQDVKRAKVQTELAKAKNLNSMADKTDLDYVHQYSGIKEKEALQRQQLQNQFNIDRETLKLLQSPKQQYL